MVDSPSNSSGLRGTELGAPVVKPDLVLTDTMGNPYDLKAATAGRLTLLYFGYTHCPDVCPTTMADRCRAAPAARRRPAAHGGRVRHLRPGA